ncbi:MAG: hypothetical protein HOH05_01265 [Marinovum sp.]|nr:hypothetical protein [Marinovum sp.]
MKSNSPAVMIVILVIYEQNINALLCGFTFRNSHRFSVSLNQIYFDRCAENTFKGLQLTINDKSIIRGRALSAAKCCNLKHKIFTLRWLFRRIYRTMGKQRLCQHAFTAIVLAMPLRLDLVPSQIVQTQQVQGLGNNASFRLPEK